MNYQPLKITVIFLLTISTLLSYAEKKSTIDQSIDNHRKGELIVKAKKGATVSVQQLKHEFWFGCALADQLFNGSASANDVKQYKELFLKNFNSAVTENAVKWPNMERKKGEINYANVDAILQWTEQNNIPLRGHNHLWGIPENFKSWVNSCTN